jgi:hypothetical protein
MVSLTVTGLDGAVALLTRVAEGARHLGGRQAGLGSPLPYATFIEEGRTRDGRRVRRAGPARYLAAGLQTIEQDLPEEIVATLPQGAGAVNLAFGRVLRRGQQRAQGVVPVRTGALRGSIVVVPGT